MLPGTVVGVVAVAVDDVPTTTTAPYLGDVKGVLCFEVDDGELIVLDVVVVSDTFE